MVTVGVEVSGTYQSLEFFFRRGNPRRSRFHHFFLGLCKNKSCQILVLNDTNSYFENKGGCDVLWINVIASYRPYCPTHVQKINYVVATYM